MKTQILITDIPQQAFKSDWPSTLYNLLFVDKFPLIKSDLLYYTPLAFMNRIVLIFGNEENTLKIYDFLKNFQSMKNNVNSRNLQEAKIFINEPLITRQRAKSVDDIDPLSNTDPTITHVNPLSNLTAKNDTYSVINTSNIINKDTPVLSVDTDPQSTGIDSHSLNMGSPSLSPDRMALRSPTWLKFDDNDTKLHCYKEPEPNTTTTTTSSTNNSTILHPADDVDPSNAKRRNPSITLKEI
ncbi:hypothetical protein TBLA_0J00390 [Henningerozyma blattae CBS 6284]|uniref:Uncharacterized protein n=1 Tax=Henningerozyma blattae (strain ATCC 34711 / CBS 6284 / DSM 70876 / NBRC 10599 / NRRL Y-10934 / UCD 77-7) TaxID=1071380 RepID=I2H9I7_HENB6|nr:hypothetical protein TBLA_0J00390 [Tetrapisispora blattae CBS 6284]CCH63039.1 hypothetical protein TBLA_0J00390 [Tetrapisispora blattae CBS 6284]